MIARSTIRFCMKWMKRIASTTYSHTQSGQPNIIYLRLIYTCTEYTLPSAESRAFSLFLSFVLLAPSYDRRSTRLCMLRQTKNQRATIQRTCIVPKNLVRPSRLWRQTNTISIPYVSKYSNCLFIHFVNFFLFKQFFSKEGNTFFHINFKIYIFEDSFFYSAI